MTTDELDTLTTLVNNYTDPDKYLTYSRTVTDPLVSLPNTCEFNMDNCRILNTLIFSNQSTEGECLDSLKTVFCYYCPNVQNFINVTSANMTFNIHDLTRDYNIVNETIDITDIATNWHNMALTGSTTANCVYKSGFFGDLHSKSCDYDCIYQFSRQISHPELFESCMNGIQWIFYNIETPPTAN